jgi:sulfur carrier protein
MKLLINGETREVGNASNVTELVDVLGLPAPTLLVEHNGLALRRNEWTERQLIEGDRIELMRISAGG